MTEYIRLVPKKVSRVIRPLGNTLQRFRCTAKIYDADGNMLNSKVGSNSNSALDETRRRIHLVPAFGQLLDGVVESAALGRSKYCCAEPRALGNAIHDLEPDVNPIANAKLTDTTRSDGSVVPRCENCVQWTPQANENII